MKILVLGYFGYRTNQLDGQTVKTRSLYELLEKRLGPEAIDFYDTQTFRSNRLSMFVKLWNCRLLVYLPAHNNLKYLFPVVYLLSRIRRFDIHYFVVGGWLYKILEHKPLHRMLLTRIKGIHSETALLKSLLEKKYGFKNVDVFPNFRFFSCEDGLSPVTDKLRLVFMARVRKEKGIDMILGLGDYIFRKNLQDSVSIDFYGPLFEEHRDYFITGLTRYPFMTYRGVLPPDEIHRTLSGYDAMLFPTHYYTEGLPGSIIDAYIAGIPVIATRWQYADEFIRNRETGLIVPFENGQQEFNDAVELILSDKQSLLRMKQHAKQARYDFSAEKAWNLLEGYIKGDNN